MKRMVKIFCVMLVMLFVFSSCVGVGEPYGERNLSDAEASAVLVLSSLKNSLRNPDSLQVNAMAYVSGDVWKNTTAGEPYYDVYVKARNIYHDMDNIKYIFAIDYSAENGFGGTNREKAYIAIMNDSRIVTSSADDLFGGTYAISTLYMAASDQNGVVIDLSKINY